MAAPNNLLISLSPLTLGHGGTAPIDGTVLHVSADSSTNSNPLASATDIYLHVTTPPTAGSITVSGVPASDFTLAQAQAGQVVYHNNTNTSAASDSFTIWARCNDGPAALPISPHFVVTATPNATGAQQFGAYFGAMLVGAADANIFSGHFQSAFHSGAPFTVTTTAPDSVLLVCVLLNGGNLGTSMPPTFTVISLSFAGLSFTRLSQQTQNIYMPSAGSSGSMSNYTMEVWWAHAPVPVSGAFTMTTQSLGVEGTVYIVDVTVFGGLANPSAPFDTNASNFQHLITTTPPWTGMAMTPNAPEYRVLPWVYELVAGNLYAVSPIGDVPGAVPRGYGTVNGQADNVNQSMVWHSAGRGPATATASISFTGPIPSPTPSSSLAMDNLVAIDQTPVTVAGSQIFLMWSDDRGHSYGSPVGQPIGAPGRYLTSVQWQRLGYARDRVFKLEWSVPVATALQGAWIDVDAQAKS